MESGSAEVSVGLHCLSVNSSLVLLSLIVSASHHSDPSSSLGSRPHSFLLIQCPPMAYNSCSISAEKNNPRHVLFESPISFYLVREPINFVTLSPLQS